MKKIQEVNGFCNLHSLKVFSSIATDFIRGHILIGDNVCKGVSTFLRQRVLTRRLGETEKGWKRHFPLFVPGLCPPSVNPFTRGENTSNMTKLFSGCQTESFLWPLLWLFSIWNLTDTHFSDPFVSLYSKELFL